MCDPDFRFEFGRGYILRQSPADEAVIVSSGRGVYEALGAAEELSRAGVAAGVVDMPSIDEELLLDLHDSGKLLVIAEQNNGFIWQNLLKVLYRRRKSGCNPDRVIAVNTLNAAGQPQFIHSGTYEELLEAFGLTPGHIAHVVRARLR